MDRIKVEGIEPTEREEPAMNTMILPNVTGTVQWLPGYAPRKAKAYLGACRHKGEHIAVAIGDDDKHMTLTQCGACMARAWFNDHGVTTAWMGTA